ncbi:phage protein Gp36 family protein [Flavobacterium palustre]|nr:phage protein Gp36 family protein [Flavobacterium palustre]
MIYLEKKDLITDAFERFIDESSKDDETVLDNAEERAIALVKTMIGSRYNVALIFDETTPIINEMLVQIISRIVLYRVIKRNAARKVPTDYKEDYDEAIKWLNDIATGKTPLAGLPLPEDENGDPTNSKSLWGNNSNSDFYI